MGAIYQESNQAQVNHSKSLFKQKMFRSLNKKKKSNQIYSYFKAAKYLYKATECSGDPSVAFNGLLKCVPNTELPSVCERYLQKVP